MHKFNFLFASLILLIYSLNICSADTDTNTHPHGKIIDSITDFVTKSFPLAANEELSINVGRIDDRLKLKNCENKLSIRFPHVNRNSSMNLVEVRCNSDVNWKIFVSVNIDIITPVVVAIRPISRGSIIKAENIRIAKIPHKFLQTGSFNQLDEVIGKKAKRYIQSNKAISPPMLTIPKIVSRGQLVTIQALSNNLQISARGIAMTDGALGDVIRVKNKSSSRIIDAKVVSNGTVKIM